MRSTCVPIYKLCHGKIKPDGAGSVIKSTHWLRGPRFAPSTHMAAYNHPWLQFWATWCPFSPPHAWDVHAEAEYSSIESLKWKQILEIEIQGTGSLLQSPSGHHGRFWTSSYWGQSQAHFKRQNTWLWPSQGCAMPRTDLKDYLPQNGSLHWTKPVVVPCLWETLWRR